MAKPKHAQTKHVTEGERGRRPWNLTILRALNPDGTLLWPGYWETSTLQELYWSGGSASFLATFMQDPSGLAGAVFNPDWFQYFCHPDYVSSEGVGARELMAQGIIQRILPTDELLASVMGVDLAVSEKETADYYGRVNLLGSRSGDVYVIDVHQDRLSTGKILENIEQAKIHNRAKLIGVGEDLMEKTLTSLLQVAARQGQRTYGQMPWLPVPTKGLDKVTRARTFALKYEQHKVFHLYGARWLTMWEAQASSFPGSAHDDLVDAAVNADFVFGRFNPRDAAALTDLAKEMANPRSLIPEVATGGLSEGPTRWPK